MKKISKILGICIAALSTLSSCNFLKVEVVGKSDIEAYFAEASALEPAIYGVYHTMFGVYDSYILKYPEVAADEIVLATTETNWTQCHNFELTSSDETTVLAYIWKNGYNVIANCNQIISHAPGLIETYPDQANTVNKVLGQALFVRALMHFDICRAYGQNYTFTPDASHLGAVIIDHVPGLSETITRSNVGAVYKQVISDLELALKKFPSDYSESVYFASPLACKALLARVYLYMEDYKNAESYASEVIKEKPLVPRDAYKDMFCKREPSADESIFRLNGHLQGHSLYSFYYYDNPSARPSARVKDLLSDGGDVRKSMLDYSSAYPDIVMKYTCLDDVSTEEERYYHPIILRSSEMFLIRAEARCATNNLPGAAEDIDALRSRAYGKSVTTSWTTKEDLAKKIEEERIRELCFEGHRFYDLTRLHKDIERTSDTKATVKSLKYPDYRLVLPIPAVELEANKAMQPNPTSND